MRSSPYRTRQSQDILRLFDVPEERVHVIYNGIDPDEYTPTFDEAVLEKHGVDPAVPFVLCSSDASPGRKASSISSMRSGISIPALRSSSVPGHLTRRRSKPKWKPRSRRHVPTTTDRIVWIQDMLPTPKKSFSTATPAFSAPLSIYEPFGIINLEAMACETPVVGSKVGGMKEIILPGETGLLIPLDQQTESPFEAMDPAAYARDLAAGINELMRDPDRCAAMGRAGRERVLEKFSWAEIARETLALYEKSQSDRFAGLALPGFTKLSSSDPVIPLTFSHETFSSFSPPSVSLSSRFIPAFSAEWSAPSINCRKIGPEGAGNAEATAAWSEPDLPRSRRLSFPCSTPWKPPVRSPATGCARPWKPFSSVNSVPRQKFHPMRSRPLSLTAKTNLTPAA